MAGLSKLNAVELWCFSSEQTGRFVTFGEVI